MVLHPLSFYSLQPAPNRTVDGRTGNKLLLNQPDFSLPCQWLERGQVMVMSDGSITTCCIDAFGQGIIGHIDGDLGELRTAPHDLCGACHHIVPGRMQIIKKPDAAIVTP